MMRTYRLLFVRGTSARRGHLDHEKEDASLQLRDHRPHHQHDAPDGDRAITMADTRWAVNSFGRFSIPAFEGV